jgi:Uncharacterised nucleotidyltransferase
MWERIDSALERAPGLDAVRHHRLELLEARRRRGAGLELPESLARAESLAAAVDLAVPALLRRLRDAWDGPLVVIKGPEVARDYPEPRLRPFWDLDVLTDDVRAAQAAMLAAGFKEVGEPALYEGIHHLRPLWWPGLPLCVELHDRPKWPGAIEPPATAELLAAAVPGRLGCDGVSTLPPAEHAIVQAAHAWAHEPLERLGHLVDIAVTLERTDAGAVESIARRWGCRRLWGTTRAAVAAAVEGSGRSGAVAIWARHLAGVRDRTVFEHHLQDWLSPLWGLPGGRALGASIRAVAEEPRREGQESWRAKLRRTRLAFAHAGKARSEHRDTIATRSGS